jgi:hypothetical protein
MSIGFKNAMTSRNCRGPGWVLSVQETPENAGDSLVPSRKCYKDDPSLERAMRWPFIKK